MSDDDPNTYDPDPMFMVSGLPEDLVRDMLHALTHAVELNLDKVLKPKPGQLTPHLEHALECFRVVVQDHRDRCKAQVVSDEMYEALGLEGEARNGLNALAASIQQNIIHARLAAQADLEAKEAMAEKHFQNLKPEDLN